MRKGTGNLSTCQFEDKVLIPTFNSKLNVITVKKRTNYHHPMKRKKLYETSHFKK